MPIELVDCHTHTVFSDGKSTFQENMQEALAKGITTIACTDHWGRPSFIDCSIEEGKLKQYAFAIERVRGEFPELEIVHGLEADWYPGCSADLAETRDNATFLLGSIHYLQEKALDWDEDMRIWEELGANELWRLYAEEWCKAATSGLFDSMAQAAREGKVHVEINTAGMTKDFADFYPQEPLLKRFFQAGVPLTVGSDAHHANRIGDNVHEAYRYARRIGYTSIDAPTAQGDWRSISIESV